MLKKTIGSAHEKKWNVSLHFIVPDPFAPTPILPRFKGKKSETQIRTDEKLLHAYSPQRPVLKNPQKEY